MDDISDKLKGILSDPEGMEKILSIAKVLQGSLTNNPIPDAFTSNEQDSSLNISNPKTHDKNNNVSEIKRLLSSNNSERTQLLTALKPFFKDEKKEKVDKIIKTIQALELLSFTNDLI